MSLNVIDVKLIAMLAVFTMILRPKRTAALWIATDNARSAPKDAAGRFTKTVTLRQDTERYKFLILTNL